jgi:hypothetical protein
VVGGKEIAARWISKAPDGTTGTADDSSRIRAGKQQIASDGCVGADAGKCSWGMNCPQACRRVSASNVRTYSATGIDCNNKMSSSVQSILKINAKNNLTHASQLSAALFTGIHPKPN